MSTKKIQALQILNEVWDLLHNLEAIVDYSHSEAIKKHKARLEKLMYFIDTAGTDFHVEVKK